MPQKNKPNSRQFLMVHSHLMLSFKSVLKENLGGVLGGTPMLNGR
jgi:hypothetical protein